jgi:protein-S-isoprenylcysteine O-methyltransferase Ste14
VTRLHGFRFRLLIGIVGAGCVTVVFGLPLFVVAGTTHWPRAWILLAVVAVGSVVSTVCVTDEVVRARLASPLQRGQPVADRVLLLLAAPIAVAWYAIAPLDVFHLELLRRPPLVVSALGLVVLVAGFVVMTLALRENPFAAAAVSVQRATGHHVIDTGVYGFVRHPMYSGGIGLLLGMPLWLGSWVATGLAIVPIAVLAVRVRIEEQLLSERLDGYREYMRRVRYRLVPRVW